MIANRRKTQQKTKYHIQRGGHTRRISEDNTKINLGYDTKKPNRGTIDHRHRHLT